MKRSQMANNMGGIIQLERSQRMKMLLTYNSLSSQVMSPKTTLSRLRTAHSYKILVGKLIQLFLFVWFQVVETDSNWPSSHGHPAAKEEPMLDSQKLTSGEDGTAWAHKSHKRAYSPPQGQPRLQEHSLLSVAVINIDKMILIKT